MTNAGPTVSSELVAVSAATSGPTVRGQLASIGNYSSPVLCEILDAVHSASSPIFSSNLTVEA